MIGYMNVNKTLNQLNQEMISNHIAVNPLQNPIATHLAAFSVPQLTHILAQYCQALPQHIVALLKNTRDTASKNGWKDISIELTRNIGEELGTQTGGITHYALLTHGAKEELNIEIESISVKPYTRAFIQSLNAITQNENVNYATGAIYACESSAVPELRIVQQLVIRLAQEKNGRGISKGSILEDFFDRHLSIWEPGHEDGIRKACPPYMNDSKQLADFEKGFRDTMNTMDAWWGQLYADAQVL